MKPNYVAVVVGVAAVMAGVTSNADDGRAGRRNHPIDPGMQDISNAAIAGQPGHGWRYFADADEDRTVAISPGGDYFYSDGHGRGPILVFKGTRAN